LSETGRDLKKVIEVLGASGVRCAFSEPRTEELDAALLVWKIHQRINRDLLPQKRTVVEFDFTGPRPHRAWWSPMSHFVREHTRAAAITAAGGGRGT